MRNTTRLKKPQIPELDTLYRFNDLSGRPKYGGVEMTSATNIPSFDDIRDETHSMVLAEANIRHDADLAMQAEIDAIVASSDVKDIVGTKAELDAYDTSTLGDNDIIKVLQDETQNDQTTYYRWSTTTETFSLIGGEGPYYTKAATDILLDGKADKATTYTKTEVNSLVEGAVRTWVGNEITASSSGTTATVATGTGDFTWNEGHTVVVNFKHKADRVYLNIDSTGAYEIDNVRSLRGFLDSSVAIEYVCVTINGQRMYRPIGRLRASSTVAGPVLLADDLTTTTSLYALSAKQGKVLKEMIDNLVIPTVVQSTGTSTTAVMSQNAVTDALANVATISNNTLYL